MSGDEQRCSARAKSTGSQCEKRGRSVCASCGVCRVHGCNCGSERGAPIGNKNAVKHGIYAVGLREDELAIWHEIPLGTLDDEIRLCRIQLRRAVEAQHKADSNPRWGLELDSASRERGIGAQGAFSKRSTTRKRPDYRSEIYRLLGRIGELEAKRAAMGGGVEDPIDKARVIRDALFQMDESMNAADKEAA